VVFIYLALGIAYVTVDWARWVVLVPLALASLLTGITQALTTSWGARCGWPALTGIDWQPDGPLVGVAPDGTVLISGDTHTWRESGSLDGAAEAIDAIAGRWHAATESGVYESADDGETCQLVLAGDD